MSLAQTLKHKPYRPADPTPAPEPLIAPQGDMALDGMADIINKTADPFMNAPPPNAGTAEIVKHGVGAAMGVVGAPFEMMDTGFAMATAGIASVMPGFPAATIGATHLGTPHAHSHPPSFIAPAPPVPLPSIGNSAASGCISVLIAGVPSARASDLGPAITCGSFSPMFEIYTGSSNTYIGGSRAARMTDITRHCNPLSAMGKFGAAMGAVGVALGATSGPQAGVSAAAQAASAAVQAAADAVALGLSMLLGKDPGIMPSIGAVMQGNPTVLVGGFPMPDLMDVMGGLMKAAKKIGGKVKKLGKKMKKQVCFDPGEPISVSTGEVYNDFEDIIIDPETGWSWSRHYRSSWHQQVGPMGRGFRHQYQKKLLLRRRSALFVDFDGTELDFPKDEDSHYSGVLLGYHLAQIDSTLFCLRAPDTTKYLFERAHSKSSEAVLVEIRSPNQLSIALCYNSSGLLVSLIRQVGEKTTSVLVMYDSRGLIHKVKRSESGVQSVSVSCYEYDNNHCMCSFSNALGGKYQYQYQLNRMVRASDHRGYGFNWQYDFLGRCVASRGDDNLLGVILEYEVGKTIVTEADGGVWVYFYNDDGVITKLIDPAGGVRQYRVNERGLIVSQSDSTGQVTYWLYDEQDHHYGRQDAWGNLIGTENDDPFPLNGLELHIPTHPQEMQTGFAQQSKSKVSLQSDLNLLRLAPGLHVSVLDILNTEPRRLGGKQRNHNMLGVIIDTQDEYGRQESKEYSVLGEAISFSDADGQCYRKGYGSWNLLLSEIDPNNALTQYCYDHRQRVTGIKDPGGHVVKYVRDQCGYVEKIFSGAVLEDRYEHDNAGRVTAAYDGDDQLLVKYEYGDSGLCVTRTQISGEVHTYSHDDRGNICQASTNDDQIFLEYDVGRRICLDQRNGLGIEYQVVGGHACSSKLFRRFKIQFKTVKTGFTEITSPTGEVDSFRVLPGGSTQRVHSNGLNELSHFDNLGHCKGRYLWREGDQHPTWYSQYHYSPAGDLLKVEDQEKGTTHFSYDAAHRVTGVRFSNGDTSEFKYDSAGNIIVNSFYAWLRYNSKNQLCEVPFGSFKFDNRSRLIEQNESVTTYYHYNSLDDLVGVSWSDGRPDWHASYDGLGRRLYKEQGGERTTFYWDGHRLAAEVAADHTLRVYVYPNRDSLSPIMFVDYVSMDADPSSGKTYYVFYDQVGLPSRIYNRKRKVVWLPEKADPYGFIVCSPSCQVSFSLRFPGHYYDQELGLHYNRFRYYNPVLARYLQSDPMGQLGGVNVHAYSTNPLTEVDVFGLAHRPKKLKGDADLDGAKPKKKAAGDGEGQAKKKSDDDSDLSKPKTGPGSDKHRAERWDEYQARNGEWSKERWDKQYDVNMKQATKSHEAVADYRKKNDLTKENGWEVEKTIDDGQGNKRRLDIVNEETGEAIEHKRGKQYLNESNLSEIERDAALRQNTDTDIRWHFDDHASKPLQNKLTEMGIPFTGGN